MKLVLDPLKNLYFPVEDLGLIMASDNQWLNTLETLRHYFYLNVVWNPGIKKWGNVTGSPLQTSLQRVWRTADNRHISVKEMKTDHIINSIYFLYKKGFISVGSYLMAQTPELYSFDPVVSPDPSELAFLKPCLELDWFYDELSTRGENIPLPYILEF